MLSTIPPPVALARSLVRLEQSLTRLEREMRPSINRVAPDRRASARNLVHYVALRQQDLRELQTQLAQIGLSSLGRSESCVLESLLQVSARANESLALQGSEVAKRALARLKKRSSATVSWETANASLHRNTHEILGPRPGDRHIYIMVTAPGAKEADQAWMVKLLGAGMNVLRINCAHEGEAEWTQIVRALNAARIETGRECRILMDLAGPKIRTGAVGGGRRIATWKPARDDLGGTKAEASVLIGCVSARRKLVAGCLLQLAEESFKKLRSGDELHFRDARDKKRRLTIHEINGDVIIGHAAERAYVLNKVEAGIFRDGARCGDVVLEVGDSEGASIDVRAGDELVLTRRACVGVPPKRARDGHVEKPGVISCTLPAALDHLEVGQRVFFDDGRIQTVVEHIRQNGDDFHLRVVRTPKETIKLRAEKGINLPDTLTTVPSLTVEDRRALPFVTRHADAVSLSFVRRPEDVRALHAALDRLGRPNLGVVLKIETRAGFENLPGMLLEGLRRPPVAVMIARGDLAVEVGFVRLSEIQEEILWLCEAAHVPAIWATQVLDTLARTGVPSRAEVTDAAASVAAECVMLNKGPFVDEAVRVLADILCRMEQHRYKKRSLFRKLQVSTFDEAVESVPVATSSERRAASKPATNGQPVVATAAG
jgi:pyruvate kinase